MCYTQIKEVSLNWWKQLKQTPMLELTKNILLRVSFDPLLFQKELNKGLRWIKSSDEVQVLKEWCIKEFGTIYPSIVYRTFSQQKNK